MAASENYDFHRTTIILVNGKSGKTSTRKPVFKSSLKINMFFELLGSDLFKIAAYINHYVEH